MLRFLGNLSVGKMTLQAIILPYLFANVKLQIHMCVSARYFGIHRIGEQRRLRGVCALQTRLNHRCSYTESMDIGEGRNQNFDL